ncbi:MAG: exodeoxyribonuclease VII large subunit [Bacteroidales bacterium]
MRQDPLSLCELNLLIKNVIRQGLEPAYWVVGEISELKINASGHCYLELIEKNNKTDSLKARARATIWSSTFRMIKPYFESTTGTALSSGIKILVRATVEFHEIYGLSLNIIDIEPTFTIGELARQKQLIITRLTEEGVVDMNKYLEMPRLPRRIAVISSKTAAGFGDFTDQLQNNEYGFKFYLKLFPAFMQGEETEHSIISALEQIHRHDKYFDVAVIIRGGGSQADLASFNNYRLALHIAQFPMPVVTGIGHEQDETVCDIVAHTSLKTPTAVAEFLISKFLDEDEMLKEMTIAMSEMVHEKLAGESEKFIKTGIRFSMSVKKVISVHNISLEKNLSSLGFIGRKQIEKNFQRMVEKTNIIRSAVKGKIKHSGFVLGTFIKMAKTTSRSRLSYLGMNLGLLEERNLYLNPSEILKRGYSITRHNNKVVKDASVLMEGDLLETMFHKGRCISSVKDRYNIP